VAGGQAAGWREALEASRGEGFGWSRAFGHRPVLLDETLEALAVRPGGLYVDATLGGGGHARAILGRLGPGGRLLGLDADGEPLEWALAWGGGDPRLRLERLNFAALGAFLEKSGLGPADGLLADLGLNSRQLGTAGRGFSFALDGPLDMRLDQGGGPTAAEVLGGWSEEDLAEAFWRLGEERGARRLARLVAERRAAGPIGGTAELAALAEEALGRRGGRIHPATRMFMALRLAVNRELESLEAFLAGARGCLAAGGRLAVISFHSLEDRLVKGALRDEGSWRLLRRKAVKPSPGEIAANPRARSARLRAAEAV
jgi:16S rRNA (cytosine1402-N4)-methyltransferase